MQPIPVPRAMMEKKPPHGAPCTRCGVCCYVTLCELARAVFGRAEGPCPALRFESGNASCGLTTIDNPALAEAARVLIFAGDGCDARFNGEPVNHEFHQLQARLDIERAGAIRAARAAWGLREG